MSETQYEQVEREAAGDVNVDAGFSAAMRAAEAEAGFGPGPGEAFPDGETAEPVAETPTLDAAHDEAEAPTEPGEDTPQLIGGKYTSIEEAERGVAEANQLIGRQGEEVARARQEAEAARQQLAQYQWALVQQQGQQQAAPVLSAEQFEMLVDENPVQAVHYAGEVRNPMMHQIAMRAWYEQDPMEASRFEMANQLEQQKAQMQAQMAPQLQAAQQVQSANAMNQALNLAMEERPDFAQVIGSLGDNGVPEMFRGNATAIRVVGEALATGDAQQMKDAFSFVYDMAKARQVGSLPEAAQQAAEQARAQARSDKVAASVASASTSTPPEQVPETEEERLSRFMRDEIDTSMRAAWTGQETRHQR